MRHMDMQTERAEKQPNERDECGDELRRALSENLAVFQTSLVMSAPQCDRVVFCTVYRTLHFACTRRQNTKPSACTLAKHTFSRPPVQSAQQLWDELALAKTPAVPTYALAEKCAIPAARAQRNR